MELGRINSGIWVLTFEGKEDEKFFWIGYNSNCLESAISNKFRMLQRYGGYPSKYNNVSTYSIPELLKEFLNKNNGYNSTKSLFVLDCDFIETSELSKIKISFAKRLMDLGYKTTESIKQEVIKNENSIDNNVLENLEIYKGEIFTPTENYKSSYYWQKVNLKEEFKIKINNIKINSNTEENTIDKKELLELLKIESILQDKTIEQLFDSIISDKARKIYNLKL